MSERCQPTIGFWAAVAVLGLLSLYPLAFGPLVWGHESGPEPVKAFVDWFVEPGGG